MNASIRVHAFLYALPALVLQLEIVTREQLILLSQARRSNVFATRTGQEVIDLHGLERVLILYVHPEPRELIHAIAIPV